MHLELRLSRLGDELSSRIPASILKEFREFVGAGEYGVGLEILCDRLSDAETPLTVHDVVAIHELAQAMGLDYPGIEDIGRLAGAPSSEIQRD
ncbi:MAG TPA: MafI family immunity protein [Luteimicrobium sp.]|nr:MafI family immunity protein [Luteimicrobium sp.]